LKCDEVGGSDAADLSFVGAADFFPFILTTKRTHCPILGHARPLAEIVVNINRLRA
jgi:hypothetical protein